MKQNSKLTEVTLSRSQYESIAGGAFGVGFITGMVLAVALLWVVRNGFQ